MNKLNIPPKAHSLTSTFRSRLPILLAFALITPGALLHTAGSGTPPLPRLKEIYKNDFLIGTAMGPELINDPRVRNFAATQFSALTPTSQMQPGQTEPRERQYTFTSADKAVEFAQASGMKVIGQTLVCHDRTPESFFREPNGRLSTRDVMLGRMKNHIRAVMTRYKGRVLGWNVVDNAFAHERRLMFNTDSFWMRTVGPDYIEKAYEFARDTDSSAELYYSDKNLEDPEQLAKALELVRRLRAKGLRIDAVGIQGHWGLTPPLRQLEEAIIQLKTAGVKVMITELDLSVLPQMADGKGASQAAQWTIDADPYKTACPAEVLQRQADGYASLFQLFRKYRDVVTRVSLRGVSDLDSGRNDFPIKGRTDYPLLFDRSLQPKPAFHAVAGGKN